MNTITLMKALCIVEIDKLTLISLLLAMIVGSKGGASRVSKMGALIAYMFVKSVPLTILLWIVVAVVFYTAIMFIRDYAKSRELKMAGKSVPAKAE